MPRYKIGDVGSGVDYMYLDSSMGSWQLSKFTVNTSQGALGSTLNQIYLGQGYKSNSSVYTFYNDAPPIMEYIKGYGHTKGVLLVNHSQGFWLSHSIPHFPFFADKGYLYPSSGKVNGQTALCVTYKYEQFLQIVQQLVYMNPRVYNCSMPEIFKKEMAQFCNGLKPPLVSERRMVALLSAKGEKFISFAKSQLYIDDIYTGWVAQVLDTDLLVETWQRRDSELPSNCSLTRHTMNVRRISLPEQLKFKSYYDHSEWCVSLEFQNPWTCLGDLNREGSQAWRGGGLVCSINLLIYKAFRQVVDWYISC
ncbi:deoxyribonuclease-2-beta [Osmerus mordax]|uniref:deoxyribonuclease-2-beta n=1 Tax=Osmerus mordax TaxID=8014 RepID=UPI00350ED296